jgi:putative FmdB family regulatory protein
MRCDAAGFLGNLPPPRYNRESEGISAEEVKALPLYPYRCTQCGHRFEKIQSFSAEPEKVCPSCGGAVERVLTAPRLQFKGAGWYVNDYAPKSGGDGNSSSKESSPAAETKAPSKTESGASAPSAPAAPAATSTPSSSPSGSSTSSSGTS